MKKKKILFFLVVLIILVIIESQFKIYHRLYDNIFLDNQNHYLPCSKLPVVEVVDQTINSHQDTIDHILAVNPGNVGFEIDTENCPGKADILIWYSSHQDRVAIQEILEENNFFGVPVRLQNR
jgi:hypothetical protein